MFHCLFTSYLRREMVAVGYTEAAGVPGDPVDLSREQLHPLNKRTGLLSNLSP